MSAPPPPRRTDPWVRKVEPCPYPTPCTPSTASWSRHPPDQEALERALEAQAHRPASGNPADARVQLSTVGDGEHTILGTGYEQLGPNTYRATPSLPVSAERDDALLEYVGSLGLTVRSGPCWLVVHDLS